MFSLDNYKHNTAVITDKGEWLTYLDLIAVTDAFAKAIPQKAYFSAFVKTVLAHWWVMWPAWSTKYLLCYWMVVKICQFLKT